MLSNPYRDQIYAPEVPHVSLTAYIVFFIVIAEQPRWVAIWPLPFRNKVIVA